jgi:hypothetical protein
MSDKLYDWETRQYVNCSDLTKDGTKWINRNRKELVYDENIENYGDKREYNNKKEIRAWWLSSIGVLDGYICLLSEFGYNQQEIAEITGYTQPRIQQKLTELKKTYKKFIK